MRDPSLNALTFLKPAILPLSCDVIESITIFDLFALIGNSIQKPKSFLFNDKFFADKVFPTTKVYNISDILSLNNILPKIVKK